MKNENKGITLVALIITIIVLLILAVVTISAVNEGKLFGHANNAATTYSKAQTEENTIISNYLVELAKHDKSNNTNILVNETLVYELSTTVPSEIEGEEDITYNEYYRLENAEDNKVIMLGIVNSSANPEYSKHSITLINNNGNLYYENLTQSELESSPSLIITEGKITMHIYDGDGIDMDFFVSTMTVEEFNTLYANAVEND